MKKFSASIVLPGLITSLLILFPILQVYGTTEEQAVEKTFVKAQQTIIELETGIEEAGELLQKIKEHGTENEYEVAEQIKKDAELMLSEAMKHRADSSGMAENLDNGGPDTVVTAVTFTSRAEADTARSYAKIGLLYLKVLQFNADNELDCAERTDDALRDKHKLWRLMQEIVAQADRSFEHANSALNVKEKAEEDAEISTRAARKCITLVRELNLHLENFEDICNEFKKEWQDHKEFEDLEDDTNPSPV
ncbi:hypothetical protein ACFLYW_04310 [Thermodesulfobacteriota bacterium]